MIANWYYAGTIRINGASPKHAAVIVTNADGKVRRSVLHTVNGCTLAAIVSVEIGGLVVDGMFQSGSQTPAGLLGSEFWG